MDDYEGRVSFTYDDISEFSIHSDLFNFIRELNISQSKCDGSV